MQAEENASKASQLGGRASAADTHTHACINKAAAYAGGLGGMVSRVWWEWYRHSGSFH